MSAEPLRHLCRADPLLGRLIRRLGPCGLQIERRQSPYAALLQAITHQQLNGRAAEAIFARFLALNGADGCPGPDLVLAAGHPALRRCGLSEAKIAAFRAISEAALAGQVPSRRAAARLSDDALIEQLTSLRGVGRWTVEMLLIFTLGRPDVLPVDDFGIREGYRLLHGLDAQPKPRALAEAGKIWAPYRSTAAWYLWRRANENKRIKPRAAEPRRGLRPRPAGA